jgi:hypothetical protein
MVDRDSRVDSIRLCLVATISHHRELGLNLAGIDLDDTDAGGNQFPAERIGKRPHGGLCCAVNGPASVRFAARNGADVDDVSSAAARVKAFDDLSRQLDR